jgi:hypothetical protein
MKVRIKLKARKDFGTLKEGETMILFNEVFDDMNGIAFYPIDRSQWAIVSYEKFTGHLDKNGKEIYATDTITNGKAKFTLQFKDYQWICVGHSREDKTLNELSWVITEKYEVC